MVLEQINIHIQTNKKSTLDADFTSFTIINPKWIIALNVKCKTVKCLEDHIGENLW